MARTSLVIRSVAGTALSERIEKSGLVAVTDVAIIATLVEVRRASLPRIFELIEDFDLTAHEVAVLYEIRDSFGSEHPSLAAIARLGEVYQEFRGGDSDEVADRLKDAVRRIQHRWFRTKLYPDQVIERIIEVSQYHLVTFDEVVDMLSDESTRTVMNGHILPPTIQGDEDE
jgi:hypothetical protein